MRVSRVRDFKHSTELTLILEGNDAQAMIHAIECGRKCEWPKRAKIGRKLVLQLGESLRLKAWKEWKENENIAD